MYVRKRTGWDRWTVEPSAAYRQLDHRRPDTTAARRNTPQMNQTRSVESIQLGSLSPLTLTFKNYTFTRKNTSLQHYNYIFDDNNNNNRRILNIFWTHLLSKYVTHPLTCRLRAVARYTVAPGNVLHLVQNHHFSALLQPVGLVDYESLKKVHLTISTFLETVFKKFSVLIKQTIHTSIHVYLQTDRASAAVHTIRRGHL